MLIDSSPRAVTTYYLRFTDEQTGTERCTLVKEGELSARRGGWRKGSPGREDHGSECGAQTPLCIHQRQWNKDAKGWEARRRGPTGRGGRLAVPGQAALQSEQKENSVVLTLS